MLGRYVYNSKQGSGRDSVLLISGLADVERPPARHYPGVYGVSVRNIINASQQAIKIKNVPFKTLLRASGHPSILGVIHPGGDAAIAAASGGSWCDRLTAATMFAVAAEGASVITIDSPKQHEFVEAKEYLSGNRRDALLDMCNAHKIEIMIENVIPDGIIGQDAHQVWVAGAYRNSGGEAMTEVRQTLSFCHWHDRRVRSAVFGHLFGKVVCDPALETVRVTIPLDDTIIPDDSLTACNKVVIDDTVQFSQTTKCLMFDARPGEWAVAFRAVAQCDETGDNPPPCITGVRWLPVGELASEDFTLMSILMCIDLVFARTRNETAQAYFNAIHNQLFSCTPSRGHHMLQLLTRLSIAYMQRIEARYSIRGLAPRQLAPAHSVRRASVGAAEPSWRA